MQHAAVVATGRSDYPNQINNVLAFPGIFRGALDVRASTITEGMKVAAGHAIVSPHGTAAPRVRAGERAATTANCPLTTWPSTATRSNTSGA